MKEEGKDDKNGREVRRKAKKGRRKREREREEM